MATTTAPPLLRLRSRRRPWTRRRSIPKKLVRARPLFDPEILRRALKDSFVKLNPVTLMKNPVIFVVEVGAALTCCCSWSATSSTGAGGIGFELQIDLWLWFTVLFATFAEAMAEARGKAQAESLRKTKTDTIANRLADGGRIEKVSSSKLRAGDVVVCSAGEMIPGDGEVIEGIATVDESVITGESAPVIRESGGDRSAVTGGTRVLSDQIKIKITSNPGETFLDRMIALVEGAERQKTPNEIALNIMIAGLTIIFLFAVATLVPYAIYSVNSAGAGTAPTIAVYVSLLVCLIPTTIGGLLSAIGIAGMDRVMQHNVLAMSGKAVEAAGDVNTLLLDKTGTITLGSRQAVEFLPASGVTEGETGGCGAALQPGRRDAGRPVDRRAGEGEVRPARPRRRRAPRAVHPVLGLHEDERRRHRGPPAPQGRDRRHRRSSSRSRAARSRRTSPSCPTRSRGPAARRSRWPTARGCSASSTSRTSSRSA